MTTPLQLTYGLAVSGNTADGFETRPLSDADLDQTSSWYDYLLQPSLYVDDFGNVQIGTVLFNNTGTGPRFERHLLGAWFADISQLEHANATAGDSIKDHVRHAILKTEGRDAEAADYESGYSCSWQTIGSRRPIVGANPKLASLTRHDSKRELEAIHLADMYSAPDHLIDGGWDGFAKFTVGIDNFNNDSGEITKVNFWMHDADGRSICKVKFHDEYRQDYFLLACKILQLHQHGIPTPDGYWSLNKYMPTYNGE